MSAMKELMKELLESTPRFPGRSGQVCYDSISGLVVPFDEHARFVTAVVISEKEEEDEEWQSFMLSLNTPVKTSTK